jgi:hypothetical protein
MGCYGLDSSGSELGPVEGSCEHANEPLRVPQNVGKSLSR